MLYINVKVFKKSLKQLVGLSENHYNLKLYT
jgi:hypothetical protein